MPKKKLKNTKFREFLNKLKGKVVRIRKEPEKKKKEEPETSVGEKKPGRIKFGEGEENRVERLIVELEEEVKAGRKSESYKKRDDVESYDPELMGYFKKTEQKYQALNTRIDMSSGELKLKDPGKIIYDSSKISSYHIPDIQQNAGIPSQQLVFYNRNTQVSGIEQQYYQPQQEKVEQQPKPTSFGGITSSSPTLAKMRKPCGGRFSHIYHDFMEVQKTYKGVGG